MPVALIPKVAVAPAQTLSMSDVGELAVIAGGVFTVKVEAFEVAGVQTIVETMQRYSLPLSAVVAPVIVSIVVVTPL